jgi:hypothetical protein
MTISKVLGAVGLLAAIGFSGHSASASIGLDANMCVCGSATQKLPGVVDPCILGAKAQLAEAARLGDSPAGRKIIVDLARQVKALAACNVGLATDLAALAAGAPQWAQVAFGAVLDGTGTGSIGGSIKKPASPEIGGGGAHPGSAS